MYGPPLSEMGTSAGAALGAAAASVFMRQTAVLDERVGMTLADELAGIRERSAARYGGAGLGEAAVDATFQRNSLRLADQVVNSAQTNEDKLADLGALQQRLLDNGTQGDKAVAAKIGEMIAKLQDIKVNVTISSRDVTNAGASAGTYGPTSSSYYGGSTAPTYSH
jgi:hypothetical protein